MTGIQKIRVLRVFSTVAFALLFVGLAFLFYQAAATPSDVMLEPAYNREVDELQKEVDQLLQNLRQSQTEQTAAQQAAAELTTRLTAMQKENTELRTTLNSLKEEMRNNEAKQQAQLKRLQARIDKLQEDAKPAETSPAPKAGEKK